MVKLIDSIGPPRKGPTQIALYVRVSSDRQAQKEDGSIDTQLDRLTSFVEYKRSTGLEWVIAEKLVEGEKDGKRHGKSAKNMDRPALQKLRELAQAGLIDVVVITKIDRISRSVIDFLLLVEELDRVGVKVVSIRENIDLTSPMGRFQTILMVALAQNEREVTSARVKEKVAWRVEKGFPLGRPPIGYVMKDKRFEIDETFAPHVRTAESLYLELESVDALVREFRKRGYRTPQGSFYVKPVVCRMLRNASYAGKIDYEGRLFDGQWKPLRSWESHLRIQRMMDKNDRRNRSDRRQSREYVYLLQGLLRCGLCGYRMSPRPGLGRSGHYYPYYCCGIAEKSVGGACPRRYAPAESLDKAVLEFMKQLHLKPERIKSIAERANVFTSETIGKLKLDLERVHSQLLNVRAKISHLVDALADGGKDAMASVRDRLNLLEGERSALDETEKRLKAEYAAEETQEIVAAEQIQSLSRFNDLVTENAGNPEAIKQLLPRFVDYVAWHPAEKGEGRLEVALFPDPVALAPDVEWTGDADGPRFTGGSQMVGREGLEPPTFCVSSRRSSQLS